MGDLWLKGMAEGAASTKRTVQYCMPYTNMILSAASLPAVTNARASEDYACGSNKCKQGSHTVSFCLNMNFKAGRLNS